MTKALEIDTKDLGLTTHFNFDRKLFRPMPPPGSVEIRFDTGIVMYVPKAIAETMTLHLEEKDPDPPSR